MFATASIGFFFFTASTSVIAQENWESGDEWRAQYKVGDKASFSISGNASDHQMCSVSENSPQGLMRVKCDSFKQWSAGSYIVYGKAYIRPQQAARTAGTDQIKNTGPTNIDWDHADAWRSQFKPGDKLQFSISGKAADLQTCTVSENGPEVVMRVKCAAFKQWKGGEYIVHSEGNLKPAATLPANQTVPVKPTGSSGLKLGEYACYGSGGRIMIGLGFKVLTGNRYTDLDGGNAGTFLVAGDTVKFRGGHLGGQTGRDLKGHNFTIGANAGCEPF